MASIWDGDDIVKAVEKAKKSKAIFVIFVEGKDEVSAHLAELFEHEEIVKKMKTDRFVAIRVEENSQMHKFFIEVYPQELSPFVCYVGSEGYVLEWITKKLSLEEFSNTIDGILERDGCSPKKDDSKILIEKEKESVVSSTTEISAIVSDLKFKKEEEVEAKGGNEESSIKKDVKEKELEQSPSSSKELSQEEKVHHAKELIEQIKEEKRKQEEEAERQKEIERRKMGQNVQQMKRWQEDEKIKQMMEERDREKKENQAARDRVLAQIAQDKVERAARFAKQGSSSAPPSIPRASPEVNKVVPKSNTTKLQFRLPEGSVYTHVFQISDTLQTVHQYIMNELNLPFINYTISTTFPRREFNDADSSQTLLDLQLVPNAVVLILPQAQGSSPSGGAGGLLGAVFWWMMAPLMSMYDFLVGFIFGAPSIGKGDQQPAAAKRSASEAEVTSRNQPKRQAGNTTEIKKQGNIHRLKERPDTDDENNTWNGNSTQQM